MSTIDYLQSPITYSEFFTNYIAKNRPCILCAGVTSHWECTRDWVENDQINVEYMIKHFGNLTATVVDCNKKYYSSHEKFDMKVTDFFKYWCKRDDRILYLKDWHLQSQIKDGFYEVPKYFRSDWLNEYWDLADDQNDDFRFVYIGVKGSWTPFHADVFNSYSWSANVCGLKKWLLYPPGEEEQLKDQLGNLPFDVLKITNKPQTFKPIEVIQKAGEIVFVPNCWYHQVLNLEDTISINHNWINGTCIDKMFKYLLNELEKVKHEIDDCKQMDGFRIHCQLVLLSCSGIDLSRFFCMIISLIKTRLKMIEDISMCTTDSFRSILSQLWITASANVHQSPSDLTLVEEMEFLKFDITKLKEVLDLVLKNEDFKSVSAFDTIQHGVTTLTETEQSITQLKSQIRDFKSYK